MGKTTAEIGRIVDEDISIRVGQYEVIYEAITNAIIAGATEIKCDFNASENVLADDDKKIVRKKVDSILISDNGQGFTDENYSAFCTYRTDQNIEMGCKGVGRLLYLKVYEDAEFQSALVDEQENRSFTYTRDFDTDSLKKESAKVKSSLTTIKLSKLTLQYRNPEKHTDRRINLDVEEIREKVLHHLIPTFYFFKKKGVEITIEFSDLTSEDKSTIEPSDVPEFNERKFTITDRDKKKNEFTLNYIVEEVDGDLKAYYCADNRTVAEFSDKEFKLSLPYGYSGYFLLEGEYLRTKANNERNDFDIYPVRTDLFCPISWEMINTKLKNIISEIVKEGIPETEKINTEKLKRIQKNRPYLVEYIEEEDIEMAGYLDENYIIDKAKKRFDRAKEKVLKNAGKTSYSDSELNEAIELTQNELVSYINDRAQVLERLRTLVDRQEQVEKVIHDLFMEKQTEDDYFCVGKNNLWLIDDRFTTYSYAASDKKIKHVLSVIEEADDGIDILNDRPDLSLFFSHNPDDDERLKSVLVEIKPFDFSSKPDRKKFHGIQQVGDYVRAFKKKENIEEIFGFVITDIDDRLAERLRNDGYIALFSKEFPIFHRIYPDGISIYVISVKTLIADAEARNMVFLDIIRKQSKLNKLLKSEERLKSESSSA